MSDDTFDWKVAYCNKIEALRKRFHARFNETLEQAIYRELNRYYDNGAANEKEASFSEGYEFGHQKGYDLGWNDSVSYYDLGEDEYTR